MVESVALIEKLEWLSLSKIDGLDCQTFCQLLKTFGSPSEIYRKKFKELRVMVSEKIALEIGLGVDQADLQDTLNWLAKANNHIVTLADPDYPKALLEIADPPPLLYAKGNIALLNKLSIAIVGSRNASVQGEKNAEAFAQGLAEHGLCIVSGLALGIDGAAHRGALKAKGDTIAVVGTGLDMVYPAQHRDLAHQIASSGLIISEFPLGTLSKPQNFPRRNRLISGLSLGCLVVEANLKSGSQITARLSAEQGREVFAIPGSIHSPLAKGCHQLIKQGAKLVDSLQDIVEELNLSKAVSATVAEENSPTNQDQQTLLEAMGYDAISIESLVQLTGLTVSTLSSMLTLLELEGRITGLAGGQYQQIV
ncbi:Smf Predicted Rossmann fold nucleotide-binding protein involved in DNA uptake [Methylophilaceae bacterium]|jgi:DNA processing protein